MRLVIAEKPSVAKSLATVLGAATRKDGYLEGNGWLVSWCLGHLAGLADAAHTRDNIVKLAGEYKRDCRVGMRGKDFEIIIQG